MRDIKFRVWDSISEELHSWDKIKHLSLQAFIDLDHYTLMQYTGLKDKGGVEIYEGDIVLVPYNRIGFQVVEIVNGSYNISKYDLKQLEIKGNICQNKELIKL